MPRRKQRSYFDQVSEFDRGRIVTYRDCGLSFIKIGIRVGRNQTTVMRICDRRKVQRTDLFDRVHLIGPLHVLKANCAHGSHRSLSHITNRSTAHSVCNGGIGYHSRTPLVRIAGTLSSQRYFSEVLEQVVLPYLLGLRLAIFQKDNSLPHVVVRIVQRFLVNRHIELLPWPACSYGSFADRKHIVHGCSTIDPDYIPSCHTRSTLATRGSCLQTKQLLHVAKLDLVWQLGCNLGKSLSNHEPHVFYRRKFRRANRPGKQFHLEIDEEPLDSACHVWSRIIQVKYGCGQKHDSSVKQFHSVLPSTSFFHRTIGSGDVCGSASRVDEAMDVLRTDHSAINGVEWYAQTLDDALQTECALLTVLDESCPYWKTSYSSFFLCGQSKGTCMSMPRIAWLTSVNMVAQTFLLHLHAILSGPEIKLMQFTTQGAFVRHDLVARIFQLKVTKLIDLITKGDVFGKPQCWCYTIEWQKRGLPHAHILLWLKEKIRPNQIDSIICAEIPNAEVDASLFRTVTKNMIHGPCGHGYPNPGCMERGRCQKKYPRLLLAETQTDRDGYPLYRRRRPEEASKQGTRIADQVAFASDAIGRVYTVHPNFEECFFFAAASCVRGPTSFAALRTINGVLCQTYKEACLHLGLLENDQQWHHCIQEAVLSEIFERDDEQLKCKLLQEFHTYKFDKNVDLVSNISNLRNLAFKLNNLKQNFDDNIVISKILTNLPEEYNYFCTAWESTGKEEKTIENLISRLTTEEIRRNRQSQPEDRVAMNATKQKVCFTCNKPGHISKNCTQRKFCKFCKKTNHEEKNCFFKNNSKPAAKVNKEQCRICKKFNHKEKDCYFRNKEKQHPIAFIAEQREEYDKRSSVTFIVDSGSTCHMINEEKLLDHQKKCDVNINVAKKEEGMRAKTSGQFKGRQCNLNEVENPPNEELNDALKAKAREDTQLEMTLALSKNPEARCRKAQRRVYKLYICAYKDGEFHSEELDDALKTKAGEDTQLEMTLALSKNPEAHCRKVQRRVYKLCIYVHM
ncbi:hypothetical protein LAZ67_6001758 [Cordylochernes scorpioides]|uniref:CCHC-type domain-containing protein n=1 Tax=Cordylochernes scorpioides TaxID=51811 RepID=A0ABY6KKE2_9ARAC|nr:hypothetical protein LAZ67_6001758 [Cordylochernes scorpioides]